MKGFHIDMNVGQFTRPYLEKWLRELARLGYDTIIWEVENNIQWETCPECVSPDAFTKDEFREILQLCRGLGLESIPLLQTIAHCEYVLKHEKYQHLSEEKGSISQYCPSNPDVLPFLHMWLAEYLEVFGPVKHFHIGADESWWLGKCPKCADYVAQRGKSELYINHINAVAEPLLARGITPIIWADMALAHPEALDKLSRKIMLFDWAYWLYRGCGQVMIWGKGSFTKDRVPPEAMARFRDYLLPYGEEPGRELETVYTTDYLKAQGFRVITCPSTSHYGDNVFLPRVYLSLANTQTLWQKGLHADGSVLTSWSVHLHPWETQRAAIHLGPWVNKHPKGTVEDFQDHYVAKRFGVTGDLFWRACGLLTRASLFTHTSRLGYDKSCPAVPLDHVQKTVQKLKNEGKLEAELAKSRARLEDYRRGKALFDEFSKTATKGKDDLRWWDLAARNLVNRAETAILSMTSAKGQPEGDAKRILTEMRQLRKETETLYRRVQRPTRRREMIAWIYDSMDKALTEAVSH
jgi:hypothetical protein